MKLTIKKGNEITDKEFPLIKDTLLHFPLIDDIADFGREYFSIEPDKNYVVIESGNYRRLLPNDKEMIRNKCEEWGLVGSEQKDYLEGLIADVDIFAVASVISSITKKYNDGLTKEEEDKIERQAIKADREIESGVSATLDDMLRNTNIVEMIETDNGFYEMSHITRQSAEELKQYKMPAYFVIDVSNSMEEENRIFHAQDLARQLGEYMKENKISDDITMIAFWEGHAIVDLANYKQYLMCQSATGTGQALKFVGDIIRLKHQNKPVFVALITDGQPNCDGYIDNMPVDAQTYTEKMSAELPENVIVGQICFAPVNPGNPDDQESMRAFQEYITTVKKVTDSRRYGQTMVLVRNSEDKLSYVALASHQKAKQKALVEKVFDEI